MRYKLVFLKTLILQLKEMHSIQLVYDCCGRKVNQFYVYSGLISTMAINKKMPAANERA